MSYALIDTTDLTSLGNAIRAKNGASSTYSLSEMVTAINNIIVLPSSYLNLTGNINNYFENLSSTGTNIMSWLFNNRATNGLNTSDITSMDSLFSGSGNLQGDISDFVINIKNYISASNAFYGCSKITQLPTFQYSNDSGFKKCGNMMNGCYNLLSVDNLMNNGSFLNDSSSVYSGMFNNCRSLKHIPHLEKLKTTSSTNGNMIYYQGFKSCYCLEEVLNLPIDTTARTSNIFSYTADECHMLGRFTFETNNGTPLTANWVKQEIKLGKVGTDNKYIGYFSSSHSHPDSSYNEVTDQATYEQYKNGNYWTKLLGYSHYNHTSAVETINSLPDCSEAVNGRSAYVNKIHFLGGMGADTDGGSVSNLTADEIAVATAKGWNVLID